MAAPCKHPEELRERAIRLVVDARKDPATRVVAPARIVGQLGISAETLRNWVTQVGVDAGARPGRTTSPGASPRRAVTSAEGGVLSACPVLRVGFGARLAEQHLRSRCPELGGWRLASWLGLMRGHGAHAGPTRQQPAKRRQGPPQT